MNFLTKTRVLVIAVVVLALTVISILGTMGYHYYRNSESKNDGSREQMAEPGRRMAHIMQLTPEQMAEFEGLRDKFYSQWVEFETAIQEVTRQTMDEIAADSPDSALIARKVAEYGQLQAKQRELMVEHLLQVKSKCTPEQQKRFRKLLHRMGKQEHMRGRMNRYRPSREHRNNPN